MLVLLKASESDVFESEPEEKATPDERGPDQFPGLNFSSEGPREVHYKEATSSLNHPLHLRALKAAQEYRRAERVLMDVLIAVDRERVFAVLGYPSLFKYAVEALGLSEATAYNFITVARKSREVPELQVAVAQGVVSVSKAKKIAAVLTQENQVEWIEKARSLSSRQLEKEVARENPRLATPERAIYISGKRLELTLGVEEALMLKLRRAQDQVSRSKNRAVSLEETLQELADFYLKHKDPVEKAKRVISKRGMQSQGDAKSSSKDPNPNSHAARASAHLQSSTTSLKTLVTGPVEPTRPTRAPIPAHIAHQVRLRDQGQCQYRMPQSNNCKSDAPSSPSKEATPICGSRRWTDLHHIQPVSQGGQNTTENLITLCRAHHQSIHRKP